MVEPTHLKNMLVKSDHLPKVRGENEKYLSCHHPEQLFLVKKSVFPGGIRLPTTKREEVLLGPLKPYYPKDQTSGGIWKTRGGEIYAIAWNKLYGSGTSFSKKSSSFWKFYQDFNLNEIHGDFRGPGKFSCGNWFSCGAVENESPKTTKRSPKLHHPKKT